MRAVLPRLMVVLGCAALVSCAPASADMPGRSTEAVASPGGAVHPISGWKVVPLTISHDGRVHHFRVEVAESWSQQARGMMFREEMGPDEGMIFPMDPPRTAGFWMKNTLIPLDMIFVGPDGRISNIIANAEPRSLDSRRSEGPVKAVLELNGGRAAELGIVPGALVEWEVP